MHTLSHAQLSLAGGHDSEAEAWRNCLSQQHGYPDTNAPWYVTWTKNCEKSTFYSFSDTLRYVLFIDDNALH